MKILGVNCGWRNEYGSDLRSYEHYLSSSENKAWKKIFFNRSSYTWFSYIFPIYSEPTKWPAPSWLFSSVGGVLHRYGRGHGSKSCTGLNFFQALFSLIVK